MTTIRSAPPMMIPPRPGNEARAAFFKAVAAPADTPAGASAPPPRPPEATAQAPQPQRILRPGSIIDIKV